MARNVRVEILEAVARPVVAIRHDYRRGHVIRPHAHRRSQLLCSLDGVIVVTTMQGAWLIPPHRGVWLPGGVVHAVRLLGAASTVSLYIEPAASAGMPKQCGVVDISPFVLALVSQVVELPVEYEIGGRTEALMTLLLHELRQLPVMPVALALPHHDGLLRRCEAFLAQPHIHETIDAWCVDLGMSRRAFTRLFRAETGLSFAEWRQEACIAWSLPLLASGELVTRVAADLGYDNPAAFTTMFKRALGVSPRQYAAVDRPTAARADLERAATEAEATAGRYVSMTCFQVSAKCSAFEKLWSERLETLRSVPGFAAIHVLRAVVREISVYLVLTVWLTEADRTTWRKSALSMSFTNIDASIGQSLSNLPANEDFLLVELV